MIQYLFSNYSTLKCILNKTAFTLYDEFIS